MPDTQVRRLPQRGAYDRPTIDAILDEGIVCHVGFVDGDSPVVVPTGYVRDGDRLLLHGARSSRLMQALAAGRPVCVTVTLLDGIVLARSGFHHSMNYRSAVLFGRARPLPPEQTHAALETYMDRLLPGRWPDTRLPNRVELLATQVVELPIEAASAKSRSGPPGDEPEDLSWPAWAGVVPLRLERGAAVPDKGCGEEPGYVKAWQPEARR